MVCLQAPEQILRVAAEDIRPVPAQLVYPQHQVDFAAVRCGHGVRQRDFSAVLRFPVLHVRGGGHRLAGDAEVGSPLQTAVKPESIGAGISHKGHIVKITVVHRLRLLHRRPGHFFRDVRRDLRLRREYRHRLFLLWGIFRWSRGGRTGRCRSKRACRKKRRQQKPVPSRLPPYSLSCHSASPLSMFVPHYVNSEHLLLDTLCRKKSIQFRKNLVTNW